MWLIAACISGHWTAAVSWVIKKISQVVEICKHKIIMLDSFHIQHVSFGKKIMYVPFYFNPFIAVFGIVRCISVKIQFEQVHLRVKVRLNNTTINKLPVSTKMSN